MEILEKEAWRGLYEEFAQKWATVWRCDFIPWGSIRYLDWVHEAKLVGNVWNVCCSLKNYEGEIEEFLANVLPHFLQEPCICEIRFEEWKESKFVTVFPKQDAPIFQR